MSKGRRWKLTYEGYFDGPANRETLEEVLAEGVYPYTQAPWTAPRLLRVDVQEAPSDALERESEVTSGQVSWFPAPGVTHPWDQGLRIFPVDHPYSKIEDEYRDAYIAEEKNKVREGIAEEFQDEVTIRGELEAGDG